MNRSITWWIGLGLFILGTIGAITPPENYPGWWAKAWGMTFPYRTDANKLQAHDPAVAGQIWAGRGIKGVGGNTRLELEQPALRQEAAAGDARVDGRAQHRVYLVIVAAIGLFLMLLGYLEENRECQDRRLEQLEHQLSNQTVPDSSSSADSSASAVPEKSTPLEPRSTDDPEPSWWTRLFGRFRRAPAPPAPVQTPIDINIVVESIGEESKLKARHVLTATLPPMTVHSVNARLKVGGSDTVQEMDLNVQ